MALTLSKKTWVKEWMKPIIELFLVNENIFFRFPKSSERTNPKLLG